MDALIFIVRTLLQVLLVIVFLMRVLLPLVRADSGRDVAGFHDRVAQVRQELRLDAPVIAVRPRHRRFAVHWRRPDTRRADPHDFPRSTP